MSRTTSGAWRVWAGLLGVVVALSGAGPTGAAESILSWHSQILVHTNSAMTVTETIRVRAEGAQIKRGIYRDFPTRYEDRLGHRQFVGFRVKEIRRDGRPEAWHAQPQANGQRIYIGNRDVLLKPGEYTYAITYETDWQIGFFPDHDELYWNVTGNGWEFPIEAVTATVVLPPAVPRDARRLEGYTGTQGSKEQALRCSVDEEGNCRFEATRQLGTREGLTLVVSWPKGHVVPPTAAEKTARLLKDNRDVLAALAGLAVVLVYFLVVWILAGQDPARGTIIPRYEPPAGMSPAAARFLWKMGYDHRCFAAALLDLAVRGAVRIVEDEDGEYSVERTAAVPAQAPADERLLHDKLLGSRQTLAFRSSNHSTVGAGIKALKEALRLAIDKRYFLTNRGFWIPGIVLMLASAVAVGIYARDKSILAGMGLWLTMWTVGVTVLLRTVWIAWRKVRLSFQGCLSAGSAVFMTLFSIPFLAGEVFGIWFLCQSISPLAVGIFVITGVVILVFYRLMKAPTLLGRKVMDEIEGFRLYLSVAEKDEMNLRNPPEKTPALFEKFLPYALALGVEQAWAERFASVLERAGQGGPSTGYHPGWYHGTPGRVFSAAAVAGAMGGALASAISSSATAPGSRSGGGGGGSSGGGGGGGGGGGW